MTGMNTSPERPLLVVKFGGTCLGDREGSTEAAQVVTALARETRPVVVCSAMGRAPAPYATDTLLALGHEAGMGSDPAEIDALLACGEMLSAALFALRLHGSGLAARSLTGAQAGISTDGAWGEARIVGVDAGPLQRLCDAGTVPVVAGFQGDGGGRLATLGRGGSDLTAVALGAALGCPVTIFTDVEGVFSADPRLIADAVRLPAMSYEDAALLSYRGAKVIHPRAAELAMNHTVEVRVTSTDAPGGGTLITDAAAAAQLDREIAEPLVIGGVTGLGDRQAFRLDLGQASEQEDAEKSLQPDWMGDADHLFSSLASQGISLDMISVEEGAIRFTVDADRRDDTQRVLEGLGVADPTDRGCAKVSVVGGGMHGRPGVMARVVTALNGRDIPILQSADSHNVISCLVPADRQQEAVEALHATFFGEA